MVHAAVNAVVRLYICKHAAAHFGCRMTLLVCKDPVRAAIGSPAPAIKLSFFAVKMHVGKSLSGPFWPIMDVSTRPPYDHEVDLCFALVYQSSHLMVHLPNQENVRFECVPRYSPNPESPHMQLFQRSSAMSSI